MNKTMKSYRLSEVFIKEIEELSNISGKSQAEIIEMAVATLYHNQNTSSDDALGKSAFDRFYALENYNK